MVVASSARAAGESEAMVSVRVYNYAKVSRRVIRGAERANGDNLDCDEPAKGVTLGLRLLSGSTIPGKDFSDEMFGFATGSDLATIF